MPRRARLVLANVPLHIIQRGNNRQACFFADEDYRFYLDWLTEYAGKTGCQVHAYVLMTNHVHLLISAGRGEAVGALMKALGQSAMCNMSIALTGAAGRFGKDVFAPARPRRKPICSPVSATLALAGDADYLVTGDRRAGLLQRGHIERTQIVTPAVFCAAVL